MDLVVRYGDLELMELNPALVKSKRLSAKRVEEIKKLHIYRHLLFERAASIQVAPDGLPDRKSKAVSELRFLAEVLHNLEFELQKAWKFPLNSDFHTWWNQIPNCRCPQMDNQDSYGTGRRYINGSCPIHGFPDPSLEK